MGASLSASHIIFFIAAVVTAGVIGAAFIGVGFTIASDMEHRTDAQSQDMMSSIAIANDPREVPYDGSELTFYVLNNGKVPIEADRLLVLLDGQLVDHSVQPGPGAETGWPAGSIMIVKVGWTAAPGDHVLTVTTAGGASDQMGFRM